MKKNERWVLVANAGSARIFRLENLKKLTELESFVHPESRLHERDLVSSKPGRAFESNSHHRHAIEPQTTQKDHEFMEFARKLSSYLEEADKTTPFTHLYVIASPKFLALLRQSFHPSVIQKIVKEVSKDVVHASTSEILEHVIE
jgi:protein required for attachment to host cells